MLANRRARISSTGSALQLLMADTLLGTVNKPARPLLGSGLYGFHYGPVVGDEVMALAEVSHGWHTGTVSVARPQDLIALDPGELYQGHPDGRTARWATSGVTTLLRDPEIPAHVATLFYDRTNWVLQRDAATYLQLGIGAADLYATLTTLHGNATVTGLTKTGTLELTNTTLAGPVTLTGTCTATGTDSHGDSVTVTGTCTVIIANSWPLTIDSSGHTVALLT